MDETYIKVSGKWCYLYRAVDKEGKTIDFMLFKTDHILSTNAFDGTNFNPVPIFSRQNR
jgi:putative transposase